MVGEAVKEKRKLFFLKLQRYIQIGSTCKFRLIFDHFSDLHPSRVRFYKSYHFVHVSLTCVQQPSFGYCSIEKYLDRQWSRNNKPGEEIVRLPGKFSRKTAENVFCKNEICYIKSVLMSPFKLLSILLLSISYP